MQVPLGILLKNENKLDEMVEIMAHLQQYVPAKEEVNLGVKCLCCDVCSVTCTCEDCPSNH